MNGELERTLGFPPNREERSSVVLTASEVSLLREGLLARVCWLETGTLGMRATDVTRISPADRPKGLEVRALTVEQMRIIVASEDLLERLAKLT